MLQCIKFILFWDDTLHVSDGLSVHHQDFKTVHTATGICQADTAVCLLAGFTIEIVGINIASCGSTAGSFLLGIPSVLRLESAVHCILYRLIVRLACFFPILPVT